MAVRFQERSIVSLTGIWTVSIPSHGDVPYPVAGDA